MFCTRTACSGTKHLSIGSIPGLKSETYPCDCSCLVSRGGRGVGGAFRHACAHHATAGEGRRRQRAREGGSNWTIWTPPVPRGFGTERRAVHCLRPPQSGAQAAFHAAARGAACG